LCDLQITSHVFYKNSHEDPAGERANYSTTEEQVADEKLKMKRPLQYLVRKELPTFDAAVKEDKPAEMSVLYYASVSRGEGDETSKRSVVTQTFCRIGKGLQYSKECCDKLCSFFSFLNPSIMAASVQDREDITTLSQRGKTGASIG